MTWKEALHWCIDHEEQSVKDGNGDKHWVEFDSAVGNPELCTESLDGNGAFHDLGEPYTGGKRWHTRRMP